MSSGTCMSMSRTRRKNCTLRQDSRVAWGIFMKAELAAAISCLLLLATPVAAQNCGLSRVESYDMVPTEHGQVGINLQVGDEHQLMVIDTGAWFSFLSADAVA